MAVGVRQRRQRERSIWRTAICGDSGRSGSRPRSSATACWWRAATSTWQVGGEPIFPVHPAPTSSSASIRGKWENTPDGPGGLAARRLRLSATIAAVSDVRHVRSSRHERHRRREERVDRADAGADAAEQSVRAVAGEASRGSRRPRRRAIRTRRSRSPTRSRWRGRRPRPRRGSVSTLIKEQSLAAFTHVVLNLDEFIYMR